MKKQNLTAWRFFTLAFYTGMRTEELLAIQRVHLRKPYIRVEQVRTANKIEHRTKTHEPRDAYVPNKVWTDVVEPFRFQEWLFVGANGKPFTQANIMMTQFQAAHDAAEMPRPMNQKGRPMPYPWRSTYASIALQQHTRPQLVAQQLGDDLATVLAHYAEFIPDSDDTQELEDAV